MREETLKGYLFVPGQGAPVVVYAKGLATLATPAAVRGDDVRQRPRAAEVRKAAQGAQAGLYRARVKVLRGGESVDGRPPWRVEKGRPVASLTDEIRKLDARARGKAGRDFTEREVQRTRQARALGDALRAHVLRCTGPACGTVTTWKATKVKRAKPDEVLS